MMYNHKTINLPEITATTTDGVRLYETPEGNKYPSITTVLSVRNKKGLFEWRKRVGEDVANYVARKAATRGTHVHHMCEDYLNNDFDEEKHKKKFLPYVLFNQLKESVLQKIDNIYAQECGLYSDKYKVAGRVDCIAEYNGELAIIDFKTSKKPKPREWIEHYFVQCMAYGCMLYELTGISVKKLVIIMACENGECVVYEERDKSKYIKLLTEYIRKFVRDKLELYGTE